MTEEDEARIAAHPLAQEIRQAVTLLDLLSKHLVGSASLHGVGAKCAYVSLDCSSGRVQRFCSWDLPDDEPRPGEEAGQIRSVSPWRHYRTLNLDDGTSVAVYWNGRPEAGKPEVAS